MSNPDTKFPQVPDADALFLGDVCFGASYGRASFEKRGFDSSFEHVDTLLHSADFVTANLETVLTTEKTSVLEGKKRYIHKDDPEGAAALKRHGIDLVSMANNHAFDYGKQGLEETLAALNDSDIQIIGAGMTVADASKAHFQNFSLKQSKFRLAIAVGKAYKEYSYHYYADEKQPGINGYLKRRIAAAQIRKLRAAEPDAFIIAYPHWGKNYRWKLRFQSKLARDIINAGADLVIGHGAHCIQEIEKIEGRWVVHSIGNFIFNTAGRFQKYPDILPYSLIARLCLTEQGNQQVITLRLYPILSDNRRTNFKPRFADSSELQQIRTRLIENSDEASELDSSLLGNIDEFGHYLELAIGSRNIVNTQNTE